MELLKYVPKDGFAELEARMGPIHSMNLEQFTDIMTEVGMQHHFLKEHGTKLDRAAIRGLFHSVDFRSFGKVNWEMLTMHIIDDAFLAAGHGQTDPENDESGAGRFSSPVLTKQSAVCRVRRLKYVPEWDRLIKVFEKPNGEGSIEITSRGSYSDCAKSSLPYPSSITCFAAVPPLSMIAAAHSDMSCGIYTASLSTDRAGYEHISLSSIITHKELEENLTSLSYHTIHRSLFAGTRNGSLFTLDMSKHEHAFNAKVSVSRRHKNLFNDSLSCMLPLEERLVCGSMQAKQNVCLYDLEKETIVENYSAHTLGVLAMARAEQLGLLVTAGFERVPFAWVYKIRDFPPWKLIDKHAPHKGHIVNVECPSDSYQAISTDDRGVIKIWDIRTFRCLQTTYGDQPAQTRLSSSESGGNMFHFHSATYHESSQTIISCGPQNVAMIHAIAPQFLDCCDDNPVTVVFYVPSHRVIVTGHGRSVKVWDELTGSVVSVFRDICQAELSACCADSTGRKLYVGTRKGHVTGHSITTGTVYKHFKNLPSEVVHMCYGVYRAQQKMLIVASFTDLVVYEDSSIDGRTYFLGQPLQTVKMDLMARFPDRDVAAKKIAALTIGGVVCQSKHSLFYMWAKRHVIAIDLGNLNMSHTFVLEHDVASVCVLGDLPAIAVLDRRGMLHVYAVRPSILSPSLIAVRNLSDGGSDDGGSLAPRKSLTLLQVARRMTAKDHLDTLQMLSITSQGNEDETQLGQVDSSMTFDQALRLLVVADAQGFCWQWSLDQLLDVMNLAPCSYPSTSRFTAAFLRRPKKELSPAAAGGLLKLVLGFQAHQEESRGVLVIDSMGSTKILTAGNDRKAKVWTRDGTLLGELCQGRFRGEEGRNPNILRAFYDRHGVTPFRLRECRKDDPGEFKLGDIPRAILPLLKKCARRFANVLDERRRKLAPADELANGFVEASEGSEGPQKEGADAPSAGSTDGDQLAKSDLRPSTQPQTENDSPAASRRGRGGVSKPNWELWSVVEQQVSLEGSLPFSDPFRSSRSDMPSDNSSRHESGSAATYKLKPKIKFTVRGAPALLEQQQLQHHSKLDVPAFLEHQCIGRTDLPLNPMSEVTVKKHQEENHERTVAANLGLEWVVYEKALYLCGPQSVQNRHVMRGVNDAVRLRQGAALLNGSDGLLGKPIPPVRPLVSLQASTPRPSAPQRMQESARETERRAVSRLLGESTTKPSPSSAR